MKVEIIVTLKNGVLDPQGKAIQQTLNGMNFSEAKDVRQGKYFNIEMGIVDEKKAKLKAEEMCKKLLANLVIEDYKIL
jgi:phosphoribosylformylglycinamidine synthase